MAYMVSPVMATEMVMYQNDDYERIRDNATAHARTYMDRQRENLLQDVAQVKVDVRCGNPADTIVETALDVQADAVVMSTHGRTGFNKWVFGSVTEKVLKQTSIPVLVVPMHDFEEA